MSTNRKRYNRNLTKRVKMEYNAPSRRRFYNQPEKPPAPTLGEQFENNMRHRTRLTGSVFL